MPHASPKRRSFRRSKAREAEVLRAEIREDMKALADYIAEHGDPAAELREMFDQSDAT